MSFIITIIIIVHASRVFNRHLTDKFADRKFFDSFERKICGLIGYFVHNFIATYSHKNSRIYSFFLAVNFSFDHFCLGVKRQIYSKNLPLNLISKLRINLSFYIPKKQ